MHETSAIHRIVKEIVVSVGLVRVSILLVFSRPGDALADEGAGQGGQTEPGLISIPVMVVTAARWGVRLVSLPVLVLGFVLGPFISLVFVISSFILALVLGLGDSRDFWSRG